jgi:hypothetical protein
MQRFKGYYYDLNVPTKQPNSLELISTSFEGLCLLECMANNLAQEL